MRTPTRPVMVALAATGLVAATACGGDDTSGDTGAPTTVAAD